MEGAFDHVKDIFIQKLLTTLYQSITDTNTWDFIKSCDPDDYSVRELRDIAWEFGKHDIDCSGDEWHFAIDHMKRIATQGWDNYVVNYK